MSAVVRLVEKAVDTVVNTVENIVQNPLPTIVSLAGQAIGIPAPVTMAAMTAAQGGDLEDIAKAAVISVAAPSATSVVANAISPAISSVITNEAAAQAVTTATSKALVNGSIAAAAGRDFTEAATGTMAGSLMASGYQSMIAPSAVEQAQKLGLSESDAKYASNLLGSSIAKGSAEAAQGNDFAAGFESSLKDNVLDSVGKKLEYFAGDTLKSIGKGIQSFAGIESDLGVEVGQNTDAGIPTELVNQVPESPEGKLAQERVPSVEDLLAQVNEMPKASEYGQQFGPELAGLSGGIIPYGTTTATDVPIDVPQVDFKPYAVSNEERSLPQVTVEAEPFIDEAKRAALTGNTGFLQENTEFGAMPENVDTTPKFTEDLFQTSFKDYLNQISTKANESASNAVDAQVQAMINPTPENIAAAQEAQMAAELDQNALNSAMQGSASATELPKTSDVLATEALAGNVPTVDQGVTGGAGNLPYDPSTDLAAFGGSEPSYGSSLPGQEGIGGIGGIGGSGIAKTGLNAIQAAIAAAANYGGKNFVASGSPLPQSTTTAPLSQSTTTAYQRKASPLIDMQSNIYMSPQEYAARSQLSNLFKVARGGLITLKNLR